MRRAWGMVLVACVCLGCSGSDGRDAGRPPILNDGGVDAGTDAGSPDAGGFDAGAPDAGQSDGGLPDGGAARYTVIDLGDLGGGTAEAYAINSSGQVVGRSVNEAGIQHAFLWQRDAGMIDLGRLGTLATNYSEGRAINDPGEVVGVALNNANTAFFWLPGPSAQLEGFLGLGFATGINATGQIAGYHELSVYTAFVRELDGGVVYMPHLGTQGGNASYASAINAQGQVVGSADTDVSYRAFLWDQGTVVLDLGSLKPGDTANSLAIAVNDLGQVVGYSDTDAGIVQHAFLWSGAGGMQDLGGLGTGAANRSEGWAINNVGQVVGRTGTSAGLHGFIWTAGAGMVDLNTLIHPGTMQTLIIAQGINDRGEIVGTSNVERALLLTPH